jgi:glycosyltransferase involved in cell wall biosynthesis
MLSFIVPAHNEQAVLGRTLQAIHDSVRGTGQPYEIIVADDASTDGTAEIARQNGAKVVSVNHRQISATRNSGARAAQGERLFFIDADTVLNSRVVDAALRNFDKGIVGGGAVVYFDLPLPLYIRIFMPLAGLVSQLAEFCGGACMFCTRAAFEKSGGFSEQMFCAEECAFILALKKQGRFSVVWPKVMTSGRRVRTMSGLQAIAIVLRIGRSPIKGTTQRSIVQDVWYDSNRTRDDVLPSSLAVRVSNGITLVLLLLCLIGPAWNFIPWSVTPRGTLLGLFRMADGFFLSHLGLIFWPLAVVVLWDVLNCASWVDRLKTAAVFAFCLWKAIGATQGVIWHWEEIWHWLR